MPLFGEGFWKPNTIYDLITLFGLIVAIFSIWYAWLLAKRDLEGRIKTVREETISRLASVLLETDITETARNLSEARELSREGKWVKALDRCEQARRRVLRFRSLPGIATEDGPKLDELVDNLSLLIQHIEGIMQKEGSKLTQPRVKTLDDMFSLIASIEGKIRAASLRSPHGS